MGYKWTIRPGAKEKIEELIKDLVLRLDAKDYLDIPEFIEANVVVKLDPGEAKKYKKFAKDMVLEFSKDQELTAFSAVALHGKLSQLANGMVYDEEQNVIPFHTKKLEALSELAEEINAPIIIVYKFNHEKAQILKLFPNAVIFNEGDTEKHVKDWNSGKIKVLLLHPASGGHGINLQEGGNHIIWFGVTPSLEQYIQTNKRLHRSGQEKPVIAHRIITEGTIDEQIAELLIKKDNAQSSFLDAMKKGIKEIL
jgi:SNF2 family DNA or RNA helicase